MVVVAYLSCWFLSVNMPMCVKSKTPPASESETEFSRRCRAKQFSDQLKLGLARAASGAIQHAMLVCVHVDLKCRLISRLYLVNYSTYYYANTGIQIVEEQCHYYARRGIQIVGESFKRQPRLQISYILSGPASAFAFLRISLTSPIL